MPKAATPQFKPISHGAEKEIADLNDYFKYILDSLDPIYRYQTAQGFQTVLAAPNRLSILHFWYLDHEEEHPDYAMDMTIPKATEVPELQRLDLERAMTMGKRLNGRFKGLLEVTSERFGRYYLSEDGYTRTSNELKVDFLHRTVRDFLASRVPAALLEEWTPKTFQVHESICKAYLADLKDCCARKECLMNRRHFTGLVKNLFAASNAHEEETGHPLTYLLEELSRVVNSASPGTSHYTVWDLLEVEPFPDFARANGSFDALAGSMSGDGSCGTVAFSMSSRTMAILGKQRAQFPRSDESDGGNDTCLKIEKSTSIRRDNQEEGMPRDDRPPSSNVSAGWTKGPQIVQAKSPNAEKTTQRSGILRLTTIGRKMLQPFHSSRVAKD